MVCHVNNNKRWGGGVTGRVVGWYRQLALQCGISQQDALQTGSSGGGVGGIPSTVFCMVSTALYLLSVGNVEGSERRRGVPRPHLDRPGGVYSKMIQS